MDASLVNAPVTYPWHEVWRKVYTHPSAASFVEILADPTAQPGRAYLWTAVVGLISGLQQGLTSPFGGDLSINLLCAGIGGPLGALMGLVFATSIMHGFAGLLGGKGTFDRLVYAFAAIQAPGALIGVALALLAALLRSFGAGQAQGPANILILCLAPFFLAWAVYNIVLQVNAVKAVEELSTGKAVMTVLLPAVLIIAVVGACIAMGLVPALFGEGVF